MSATGASGTNAVRYGTMRENVLALTVVTGEAKVIRTARRARKSSAGYDLTRLFVGSEGTLGVITEVTLRIYPQPEAVSAASCSFPTVEDAVQTTIATIQMGIPIARCELLDALTVQGSQRARQARTARDAVAVVRVPRVGSERRRTGRQRSKKSRANTAPRLSSGPRGPEDRTRLWEARHNAYFACLQLKPGCRSFTTDVCVPISRLAECIAATVRDTEQSFLPAPILGHVGDGNFHCAILADTSKPEELAEAERLNKLIVARALAMDGTCTGEHGVGMHKMDFLREEHGDDALELMARIKRSFDPLDILNPGKVVRV